MYKQVKTAYINFLNHCYVDTEVEMKEIYTSKHMWTLFENFLLDIAMVMSQHFNLKLIIACSFLYILKIINFNGIRLFEYGCCNDYLPKQVCNATHDRKHANTELEQYVTVTVMNIITTFFSSPFSDQSTNIQVRLFILIKFYFKFRQ